MILQIDTTKREIINLGLIDAEQKCFEIETADQSNDILTAINDILKKHHLSLKDIKAIIVNRGPGSFTGVRIGVVVANTLAWSLEVPVLGYRDGELEEALVAIGRGKTSQEIVTPIYGE